MSTGNGQSLEDLFSCSQRPGAWMGAAYVIFQDPPDETRPMGHTGAKWPADWAPLKRNKSRSRSPLLKGLSLLLLKGVSLLMRLHPKRVWTLQKMMLQTLHSLCYDVCDFHGGTLEPVAMVS